MFRHLIVLMAIAYHTQAIPRPEKTRTGAPESRQFVPALPQFNSNLQYGYAHIEPQFQISPYGFDKQPFHRGYQPQIFLYNGGAIPGQQPFLLQPGAPPGNFLVPQPQPGPNVIYRQQPPQRPLFVAGYPKPAHVPPIEKDAEEIPTNPSQIPPMASTTASRPQKLETFNEPDIPEPTPTQGPASEADGLAGADRNPYFNFRAGLRPGQSFFILNGQNLYSNYPILGQNPSLKYGQGPQSNFLPQNSQVDRASINPHSVLQNSPLPDNFVLLNQDPTFFRNVESQNENIPLEQEQIRTRGAFGLFQGNDQGFDSDTVVIDAKLQDENADAEADSDVVAAPETPGEPSVAQAQPGAIALAGPGGTAAAAPRGQAFAGKEGVAVSSPQATAVAGPSRNEEAPPRRKPVKKRGN